MPFGTYKNMKDCIAKNGNKSDPAAYCASIMKKAEKESIKFEYGTIIEKFEPVTEGSAGLSRGIVVHGIACKEVVSRNGIKYLAKELQNAAPGMKGRPILKDHKNDVDHIVGKVIDATYLPDTKEIKFKGLIVDTKTQDLIMNGLINHVSIGASVKNLRAEESGEDKFMVAEGLEILELSVTPVPGVPDASIMPGESMAIALQEAYKGIGEEDDDEAYVQEKNKVITEKVHCPECDKEFADKEAMSKHKEKEHSKKKEMEANKMAEEAEMMKLAKDTLIEAVMAVDKGWTLAELSKFEMNSLKVLLEKARAKAQELIPVLKAEPKGVVNNTPSVKEEDNNTIIVPSIAADSALKEHGMLKTGTFVVEQGKAGKTSFWRMPDYKKQKAY